MLATISEATHGHEANQHSSRAWEFTQLWQDRSVTHTCQTSHDRVKATPMFDVETGPLVTSEPVIVEIPEKKSMIDYVKLLDPDLLKESVIEPDPFVPYCTKPDISKAETREERQVLFRELPKLYKEFNECKKREEKDRILWEREQEASLPKRIAEEKERKINIIGEALDS